MLAIAFRTPLTDSPNTFHSQWNLDTFPIHGNILIGGIMSRPAIVASAAMPAPRQKNCDSCVQAKRRCDRRTPCARCVEKKTTCIYSKSKTATRLGKHAREPTPCTEILSLETPTYSPLNVSDLSFDLEYLENIPTGFHAGNAHESTIQAPNNSGDSFMDTFMQFTGSTGSSSSNQWFIRTEESHLPERPATPTDGEVVRAWDKMAMCVSEVYQSRPGGSNSLITILP